MPYSGLPIIPGLNSIDFEIRVPTLRGMVPYCVHGSVFDVRGTGHDPATIDLYQDLEFTWNFGDAGATRTLTNPTTEETVTTNADQVGPEAVHAYDTPGTYTISVTARGWNGVQYVTRTKTVAVVAATVRVETFNATAGTFTLRVQQGKGHARAVRTYGFDRVFLSRDAGHGLVPGATGFTFATWFRRRGSSSDQTIAAYYGDANGKRSWRLQYRPSADTVVLTVGDATSGQVTATVAGVGFADGVWRHVACWCNVTTGEVGVVVNNGTVATGSRTPGLAMQTPADVPFSVGGHYSSTGLYAGAAEADFDEAVLFDRPPQTGEVAWLYNAGAGRHWDDVAASSPPGTLATGMVAWWTFDEVWGPTWADSTGNGHTLKEARPVAGQRTGAAGVPPKVYRPGGVETAPLAYNAWIDAICAAVTTAAGVASGQIYDDDRHTLRFGGTLSGSAWTLAPGTLSGDFDGLLAVMGYEDGEVGPTVTATAWDTAGYPEIFFDSNAAPGGNGSALTPYNDVATLVATLKRPGGGVKISLAAGSDFDLTGISNTFLYPMSPIRVSKWGTGAKPIIRKADRGIMLSVIGNNDDAINDVVFDNVRLIVFGSAFDCGVTEYDTELPARRCGIHLLDVDIETTYSEHKLSLSAHGTGSVGMWGGSISGGGGVGPGKVSNGRESNLQLTHWAYGSVVGVSISGGGCPSGSTGVTYGHHIYWSPMSNCSLGRWIRFGPTAPYETPDSNGFTHHELNFCIKGSVTGYTGDYPRLNRGFVVDSCVITGTQNPAAWGRQNTINNLVGNGFDRVVLTHNRVYKSAKVGNQNLPIYFPDMHRVTVRDNTAWNNPGFAFDPQDPGLRSHPKYYRNRTAIIPAMSAGLQIGDVASLEMMDNVFEFQGASGGTKRAAVVVASIAYLSGLSRVMIDRNHYFFPGQPDGLVFRDNDPSSTMKTLAQWQEQGWDNNVTTTDPGWPSPETGNFGDPVVTPPPDPDPDPDPIPTGNVGFEIRFTATGQGFITSWPDTP